MVFLTTERMKEYVQTARSYCSVFSVQLFVFSVVKIFFMKGTWQYRSVTTRYNRVVTHRLLIPLPALRYFRPAALMQHNPSPAIYFV